MIALSSCYTSLSRMELQTLFLIFLFCHIPFFVIFAVNETNYIKVFDIQIRHGVIKILVRVNFFFQFIKAGSATITKTGRNWRRNRRHRSWSSCKRPTWEHYEGTDFQFVGGTVQNVQPRVSASYIHVYQIYTKYHKTRLEAV